MTIKITAILVALWTMFAAPSLWQSRCKRSSSSCDKCRTALGRTLKTEPTDVSNEPPSKLHTTANYYFYSAEKL